jgi:hypothetical protein
LCETVQALLSKYKALANAIWGQMKNDKGIFLETFEYTPTEIKRERREPIKAIRYPTTTEARLEEIKVEISMDNEMSTFPHVKKKKDSVEKLV